MLLDDIRNASLEARRAAITDRLTHGDRASLLVTLFAEAARVGKDAGNRGTTDEEVVKVVRKFLKGVEDSLAVLPDGSARLKAMAERVELEKYLPQLITGDVLSAHIADLVAQLKEKSPKAMGAVMKALKEKLGGAYDGVEASALVKSALL